jgi:glycosyltransferase involved in cell wall biosynthesis
VDVPSVAFPPYPDIRLAAPAYRRVADVVRRFRPDIVHSATEFMIGRLGQIAAQRHGAVRLSSYHTDFSRYTEAYGLPWLRGSVARYIRRFHARSARVFTPSVPARQDLLALGLGDVEVWGCGVDLGAFSPARRSPPLRAAYAIDDAVVFLHVGRLAAEKGVDRIVRAFAQARELLPAGAARLVIAGAGPEEGALRALAGPDVLFLGVLDRTRALPRLYASADAFLFSSLTETLGLVVLEAMASGLPVVATPAGGVADHLRDEVNGIACPPNDVDAMARAIVALTLDRQRRRRLAAGARQTAALLDWERELDRLDASYRAVIDRAKAARPASPADIFGGTAASGATV